MRREQDIRELAMKLSAQIVAAVEPDQLDEFKERAASQLGGLKAQPGIGFGGDPMADFLSSTVLPAIYHALLDLLQELRQAGIKEASEYLLVRFRRERPAPQKTHMIEDAKINQAVENMRKRLIARGFRADAADALVGLLLKDLLLSL